MNELTHYGVPGMKWGVRRAQKRAHQASLKESVDLYKKSSKAERKDVTKAERRVAKYARKHGLDSDKTRAFMQKYSKSQGIAEGALRANVIQREMGHQQIKHVRSKWAKSITAGMAAVGTIAALNKVVDVVGPMASDLRTIDSMIFGGLVNRR